MENPSREGGPGEDTREDPLVHRPTGVEARLMAPIPSLEAVMSALKEEKSRLDRFELPGQSYEVETHIRFNDREWCFSSGVKLNDSEIADDLLLIREELCRKRVAQTSKTKALWHLFVKEAAKVHLDKCTAVRQRIEASSKRQRGNPIQAGLGAIALASVMIGLALFYLTRPPVPSTVLTPSLNEPPPPLTPVALTEDAPATFPPPAASSQTPVSTQPVAVPEAAFTLPVLKTPAQPPAMVLQPSAGNAPIPAPETIDRAADSVDAADRPAEEIRFGEATKTGPLSPAATRKAEDAEPSPSETAADLTPQEIREQVSNLLKGE